MVHVMHQLSLSLTRNELIMMFFYGTKKHIGINGDFGAPHKEIEVWKL